MSNLPVHRPPVSRTSSSTPPTRRASASQDHQEGPTRPVTKRQESYHNTANRPQVTSGAPPNRQDIATNRMAESGRRGSTNSQSSVRGTRPEATVPSGVLSRHNSNLNKTTAHASRAPASVKQISHLTDVRYVGIITATHDTWDRQLVISIAAENDRDKEVTSDLFLAGSTMRTGQHVYLGRCQLDGCLNIQQYFTSEREPAQPGIRRGSTSSQKSARGAQAGSTVPPSALQNQNPRFEGAKKALGPSTSASVEEQISNLKKTGAIGFISKICGNKVKIVSSDGAKRTWILADRVLAGSGLQVGLQVCKGLDAHSKTRIFTPVVPSEEYEGLIVAHPPIFTGIGVVTVRPPSPGQPFNLSSDSCEGATRLDIGLHVYQRTASCKYFTRAIGPE